MEQDVYFKDAIVVIEEKDNPFSIISKSAGAIRRVGATPAVISKFMWQALDTTDRESLLKVCKQWMVVK